MLLFWSLVLICLAAPCALIALLVRYCDVIGTRGVGFQVAALFLAALGTVPPSTFAILWYVRETDLAWAISGPVPFSYLGAGPPLIWGFLLTGASTTVCWLTAVWLSIYAQSDSC